MDTAGLDAGYWYRSLRHPVRFAQAVRRALADEAASLFVECSPHPVLASARRGDGGGRRRARSR